LVLERYCQHFASLNEQLETKLELYYYDCLHQVFLPTIENTIDETIVA